MILGEEMNELDKKGLRADIRESSGKAGSCNLQVQRQQQGKNTAKIKKKPFPLHVVPQQLLKM